MARKRTQIKPGPRKPRNKAGDPTLPLEKALSQAESFFIEEYMVSMDRLRAVKAGWPRFSSTRAAHTHAYRVMQRPHVRAALSAAATKLMDRAQFDALEIVEKFKSISRVDIGDICEVKGGKLYLKNLNQISDDARYAIHTIRDTQYGIEIKLCSKTEALTALGRYHALFTDRLAVGHDSETGVMVVPGVSTQDEWLEKYRPELLHRPETETETESPPN